MVPGAQGAAGGCSIDAAPSPQGLRLLPGDRLRKRFEFGRVRDQGRRVYTESFVLMVRRGDDASAPARLGLTVSQKVGGAVRRNRVKRLLREVFRRERALFPRGAEVVVIAKAGATVDGFDAVRAQIAQAAHALAAALARAPRGRELTRTQSSALRPKGPR